MTANGIEGSVPVAGVVDCRDAESGAANPATTWKGFLISESKSTVSKLATAAFFLAGGIGIGVGIEQRRPAIYTALPIISVLAETFYLGGRAYHYFKSGNHGIGETEGLVRAFNTDAIGQMVREPSGASLQERVYLPDQDIRGQNPNETDPVALLPYFESLWKKSVSIKGFDFDQQVDLLKQLKASFQDYFYAHPDLQEQSLFKDYDQCKATFEGICKHYNLTFYKANTSNSARIHENLTSVDNGDCLYDSIWQSISDDKKTEMWEQYSSELENEPCLSGDHQPDYDVLKVVLLKTLEQSEALQRLVMTNNQDPQSPDYSSISEYQSFVMQGGTFWGRHNVEGVILATALSINVVLTGAFEFDYMTGFFEREDKSLNEMNANFPTVYIGNRHLHYYPVSRHIESA